MRDVWERTALTIFLLSASISCSNAAEFISDFDGSSLDAQVWNDCQIDKPSLKFEEQKNDDGTTRRVLRNVVDQATGNIDQCLDSIVESDETGADPLGPSLVATSPLEALGAAECQKGSAEFQRNELRLQQNPDLVHRQDEAHWYSITFRADGDIPSCGSARWILAQWKQEKNGPSPFLAQRFDNGVLHVTVQNGNCRCVVAKADGDFDAIFSLFGMHGNEQQVLEKSQPIKCIRSDLENDTLCQPTGMSVQTIGGMAPPPLPDPKRGWVTMTYLVRGGSDEKGEVEVYANNQFIVRVTGLIGYKTDDPGLVKFKFGHYRNRINGAASTSVDRICLSPDPDVCAPDLKRFP